MDKQSDGVVVLSRGDNYTKRIFDSGQPAVINESVPGEYPDNGLQSPCGSQPEVGPSKLRWETAIVWLSCIGTLQCLLYFLLVFLGWKPKVIWYNIVPHPPWHMRLSMRFWCDFDYKRRHASRGSEINFSRTIRRHLAFQFMPAMRDFVAMLREQEPV